MTKKLYVGNLSYNTTDEQLRDVFAPYGEVTSARVAKDRNTGRSRGFAFVEMADDASANAAVDALNGKSVDGRQLKVAEAKPREPRSDGGGYRGGGGGGGDRGGDRGGYRGGNDRRGGGGGGSDRGGGRGGNDRRSGGGSDRGGSRWDAPSDDDW